MLNDTPNILPTIVGLSILSFIPFLVVMTTAFTKIAIVLMLLRNALGVQQAPSGLVINSIALTLTMFIIFPIGVQLFEDIQEANIDMRSWDGMTTLYNVGSGTMIQHLTKISLPTEIEFFMQAAYKLWPESLHSYITKENLFILLPAHITSELTRAFEISFLLFLPFLVIDLVVSNILLAMGAMMVPPMLLSLPVKLLLFVAADGWTRLLHGLILSYA